MARPIKAAASDGASDAGSVVIMVLLAAFIPVGCVLWFLNAAMENQDLAVRQRLTDVYSSQFYARKNGLAKFWDDVDQKLEQAQKLDSATAIYKLLVGDETCGAVIVYDESGQVIYPRQLTPMPVQETHLDLWAKARRLEDDTDHDDAAVAYEYIARRSDDLHLAARAIQAQIRCLIRAGRTGEAIDLIADDLCQPAYRDALDASGRLIAPAAQLLALQIGDGALAPERSSRFARLLAERLWNEDDAIMPSVQRLFLIHALRSLDSEAAVLQSGGDAAMRAYRLDYAHIRAEDYLDGLDQRVGKELAPAGTPGMWSVASSDGRIVALFSDSQMDVILAEVCDALPAIHAGGVAIQYNPSQEAESGAFISEPVGKQMPGWRIALFLKTPDPFQAAADRQRLLYFIIAGVAIGLIALLSGATGRYVRRQMRLTRLKNDLIATVSHELKTPLASMRVLIDTLVDGRISDKAQADEYLQLIARENLRLSRLIDNFLTFSRMERNKRAFEFDQLHVADIVDEAIASTGDRFIGENSCLKTKIAADLPPIAGDCDALVTVILNLLDNAWKYSGDDRAIRIKADLKGRFVRIKVVDNGIGMPPRTVRRIFNRFYQADNTLTRSAGGCGLGLSIVKFILDAHRASIEVVSRPGSGSTFIVKIPAQPHNGNDT